MTFVLYTDLLKLGPGLLYLHGGDVGWDRGNWTIVSQSKSSLSLSHVDPDGFNGFPGTVYANVCYIFCLYEFGLKLHIPVNIHSEKQRCMDYHNSCEGNEKDSNNAYIPCVLASRRL